jgi:hypothetical protein
LKGVIKMSKLTTIKNAISRTTGRGGLLLKKNSPEILLGVGVVGIIASTVMACKATLKVDDILNDADEKIGKINSV